ncbi:hypothetical protein CPB85DRAFT_481562 [Mucidula mucida]|nr:hypothetical protein CPB85DRAFT_481562 [Mucidula mucida]
MSIQQDDGVEGWAAYHPYDLAYDYPCFPGTTLAGASYYDAPESPSVSGTSTTPCGASSSEEGTEMQKVIQALQLQVYIHQQSAEVNQKLNKELRHRNEELSAELEVYEGDLQAAEEARDQALEASKKLCRELEHTKKRSRSKVVALRGLVERERRERRLFSMQEYNTIKKERQHLDKILYEDKDEDLEDAVADHVIVLEDIEERYEKMMSIGAKTEMAIDVD